MKPAHDATVTRYRRKTHSAEVPEKWLGVKYHPILALPMALKAMQNPCRKSLAHQPKPMFRMVLRYWVPAFAGTTLEIRSTGIADPIKYYELPRELRVRLPVPPPNYRYVQIAGDNLMIAVGTDMVVDAIEDILRLNEAITAHFALREKGRG